MCSLKPPKLASCIGLRETVGVWQNVSIPRIMKTTRPTKLIEKIAKKMADTPREDLSQAAARIVREGCVLEVSNPSVGA